MDGKIFDSEGHYVGFVIANAIYSPTGKKLYELKGENIYRTSGELVGHLNSTGSEKRLNKSTDKLFPQEMSNV